MSPARRGGQGAAPGRAEMTGSSRQGSLAGSAPPRQAAPHGGGSERLLRQAQEGGAEQEDARYRQDRARNAVEPGDADAAQRWRAGAQAQPPGERAEEYPRHQGGDAEPARCRIETELGEDLSLIHISEPTRQAEISY